MGININVNFDGQYKIVDNTDIGTVRILMLKGEKGDTGTSDYNEATNKPKINGYTLQGDKTGGQLGLANIADVPTKTSDLTNDSGFITSAALPTKTSDLTNDSGFITSADVPTKTSELTNDSGFITSAALPTKTSDLTNDSGFITSAALPTKTSDLTNDSGFITSADVPTKTSELTNDSGFITSAALPTKVSDLTNDSGFLAAAGVVDLIYPVGSIYMSVNNVTPSTLFGGTWVQIKDTFLLACGDTYTNGATGGEAAHTLTLDEIPAHTHGTLYSINGAGASGNGTFALASQNSSSYAQGQSKGGGQAHNNMPPYLAVNVWQRTA